MTRLVATLAAGLGLASAAAAHGPTATQSGYVSNVSAVTPNVLGLFVNVLGGDQRLRVSNYSHKTVVILGYQGEPYLRFDRSGVFQNVRSPAVYINGVRGQRGLTPASASPTAAPVWRKVAGGASFAWPDHRIRWVRSELPPGVKASPKRIQRVFAWRVPGRADGKPFVISGILGFAPATGAGGGGRDWAGPAIAAALAAPAVAGLAVWAWVARRRKRQATQP